MNHPNFRSSKGFTLIELVVVMAIFSVVSAGVWQLLAAGNRSFEETSARSSAVRSASVAIEWVRRDLARLAVERPHPPLERLPRPVRLTAPGELQILAVVPPAASSLSPGLERLAVETIQYRLVPQGSPEAGLYRNGQRLTGLALDRFEASLVTEPETGALYLALLVGGAEPAGHRSVLVRDLVLLDGLERLRRHRHSVPNPVPALEVPPDPLALP
jgi:prepilin-type N-terminal cleavage/methylation domain-containing protein